MYLPCGRGASETDLQHADIASFLIFLQPTVRQPQAVVATTLNASPALAVASASTKMALKSILARLLFGEKERFIVLQWPPASSSSSLWCWWCW